MLITDINLDTGKNVEVRRYPDGQSTISIPPSELESNNLNKCASVTISLTSAERLLNLMQISSILRFAGVRRLMLRIPYLYAARSDRRFFGWQSFDLKIVANIINSCGFENVQILHPHSEIATALIENSMGISNAFLVQEYNKNNAVLICPDAGAAKHVPNYLSYNPKLKDVAYCTKIRDVSSGKLQVKVLDRKACFNRHCVIIDDLCDGGSTFLEIAKQITPKSLTLIVTHGIFSGNNGRLAFAFDEIIVSDSFCKEPKTKNMKVIPVWK